jgi:hypothetical protein
MRLSSLSALVFIFASTLMMGGCGASKVPAHAATRPAEIPIDHRPDAYVPPPASCPDRVDVAALFQKNRNDFGDETNLAGPFIVRGTVRVANDTGTFEQVSDPKRMRHSIHVEGFERASGIDENGPWQLGNSGAVSRLRSDEARATDDWILRRHYLSAFDPKRDTAVCTSDGKKGQIIIHEKIAELGSPRLLFDLDTSALVGAEFVGVDGTMSTRSYEWGDPGCFRPGFPSVATAQDGNGATIEERIENLGPPAADAFAMPASILEMTWPKTGTVTVPMKLVDGEIFFDVLVGGKKARARLDSSAGLSIVDPNGKASEAFTSELEVGDDAEKTDRPHLGIGKLSEIRIGALVMKKVSAARVPIPASDAPDANRPDVVIGWSVFEGNVVRIDYARNQLVFSRDSSSSSHAPDATAVDLHVWNDKLIAPVKFADRPAPALFQIATGKPFGLAVSSTWAKRNQFVSTSLAYAIGPIASSSDPIALFDGPDLGLVAGLIGDRALAKCAAVTFDVPNRKLWLEAPCSRTAPSH